ncbi:urea carboxylase [Halothiobacillus diazotrophicus]|uniref:Biotin carboxylase n=1 Tax=Halothiobacillus diazotrophicus TaxID=1860122 RepID=A0A191ZHP0_9GAMM|nr:urea carboxylase [Halothiobacillus diazotrophicus]ANJ67372.1 urea carboxylase [Halothiobacillus diazotrophicus]
MFKKVLIANRGAIACRIIRTLKEMGIASVAVYSEADRHARHVIEADEAIFLGPAPANESYLRQDKILDAARSTGAEAIHPGYGFLSENAAFAEACEANGIAFIGPTPQQMCDFGLKHTARELAERNAVPLLPGSGLLNDAAHALTEAERIGYPVMLKSTAGGGGIGMQLCWNATELGEAFHSVERLSRSNFSQGGIFLEKYVEIARHIEVQIFGDGRGNVVALGERDCSVQRRNQKVIEETPAPGLDDATRAQLYEAALRLGRAVNYRSAGTVEFVYDVKEDAFYFLEVNTRLQVEHGVTEMVTGTDLVAWMLQVAANEPPTLDRDVFAPQGHAVQVRLYAEDPGKQFQPSAGLLNAVEFPDDQPAHRLRIDSWIETGTEVSAYYDPMLAKIIAHGADRTEALANLAAALKNTRVYGIETNLDYLQQVIADDVFVEGRQYTRYLGRFAFRPRTIDVLSPGTQSMIQDYPGRTGYWDIGVPPSGPMDALAFRVANRIVGNPEGVAGLELTITGPTLRFNADTVIALTGARMKAELDGVAVAYGQPVAVAAGAVLKLRGIPAKDGGGGGSRTYLAVQGGFDVPDYMGSKSTFTLGQFGGHAGRTLRVGDVLRLNAPGADLAACTPAPASLVPDFARHWNIAVMYGPHGAPDFFTDEDIATFFATDWEVHYNSSRTGVRLIGPKPAWARRDGGEAGLHPSNIHDNAYAIGAVDFTGDMPVILGPDGPSLGGFVCPVTIVQAELWKMGQLKPGDTIRFHCIDVAEANRREAAQDAAIAALAAFDHTVTATRTAGASASPILYRSEHAHAQNAGEPVAVCYRQAGDKYLLVEYGPLVLDLDLRFRVHALMTWMQEARVPGILDLTPGIRSLQVHYDSRIITQSDLLAALRKAEAELPAIDDMEVPSRIVHLPLSWDDPSTQLAIEKYMQSVRPDAPWCPSNIEFIRRINGLDSIDAVQKILFSASYLVMGLGDVYLGAPVATPMDPRHRLVTTKYNPARTWTPENAVGIGGAYLCVYGMEGPGGYQFVGRTVQMWNRYRQTADFTDGKQWLLRFFDQLRFYPVSSEALAKMREEFPQGRFKLKIEETVLKLRDYRAFIEAERASIDAFQQHRHAAFEEERERWVATGQAHYEADPAGDAASADAGIDLPEGCEALASPVTGSVWQVAAKPGDRVAAGQALVVVEAMKMEIAIEADEAGTVVEVLCAQGTPVSAGQTLLVLRPDV